MLRPTIRDDAGRPVPLVWFNVTYIPIFLGPLPRGVQVQMRDTAMVEARKPGAWRNVGTWLPAIVIGVMPGMFMFGSVWLLGPNGFGRPHSLFRMLVPIAPVPFILAGAFACGLFFLSRDARRASAAVAVRRGYCASCGYPLAGLAPGPDGLTTCPECRAAWRAP